MKGHGSVELLKKSLNFCPDERGAASLLLVVLKVAITPALAASPAASTALQPSRARSFVRRIGQRPPANWNCPVPERFALPWSALLWSALMEWPEPAAACSGPGGSLGDQRHLRLGSLSKLLKCDNLCTGTRFLAKNQGGRRRHGDCSRERRKNHRSTKTHRFTSLGASAQPAASIFAG